MIFNTSKIKDLANAYLEGRMLWQEATNYIQLKSLSKNVFINLDIFYFTIKEVTNEK